MNLVILKGKLIQEPEIHELSNCDLCVLKIGVIKDISKEKIQEMIDNGEYIYDIYTILVFNKYGKVIKEALKKGSNVLVEGRLSKNKVEKDGNTYYNTSIVGKRITFLDKNSSSTDAAENKEEFFEDDFQEVDPGEFGVIYNETMPY